MICRGVVPEQIGSLSLCFFCHTQVMHSFVETSFWPLALALYDELHSRVLVKHGCDCCFVWLFEDVGELKLGFRFDKLLTDCTGMWTAHERWRWRIYNNDDTIMMRRKTRVITKSLSIRALCRCKNVSCHLLDPLHFGKWSREVILPKVVLGCKSLSWIWSNYHINSFSWGFLGGVYLRWVNISKETMTMPNPGSLEADHITFGIVCSWVVLWNLCKYVQIATCK